MDMYFETQKRQQCALHATNNILQRHEYTRASFDRICKTVLPAIRGNFLNPYKSPIPGLGNYDASVIVAALNEQGFDMEQHDRRKDLDPETWAWPVVGAIVNMAGTSLSSRLVRWSGVGDGRHFFCLRRRSFDKAGKETWVLLDSKLPAPGVVGSLEEALAQLRLFLQRGASVYTVKRRQPRTQEEDGEGEEQVEAQGKEKEGSEDKDGAGQEERKGFCNAEERGEKARKYNNTTSTPQEPNEISTSLDAFNDNGTTSSLHVS